MKKNNGKDFEFTISHEIKAPLSAIEGYAQKFLEDYKDKVDEEGLEKVENIISICKDTLCLINKLLDYTTSIETEATSNTEVIMDGFEWVYPTARDEKMIINYFKNRNESALQLFETTLGNIYNIMGENTVKSDVIIKKIYNDIVRAVYSEFKWLKSYLNIDFFKTMDCIYDGNADTLRLYYYGKIKYLFEFIKKYFPDSGDNTMNTICEYILCNLDEDLKLKVIADKFYMNNSYLSISFSSKTGRHFNDYVTMVKMARAECLFKNSNQKIYEISDALGYKDTNYFSKLFKRYYGKSPSEYRNLDYIDYQI